MTENGFEIGAEINVISILQQYVGWIVVEKNVTDYTTFSSVMHFYVLVWKYIYDGFSLNV